MQFVTEVPKSVYFTMVACSSLHKLVYSNFIISLEASFKKLKQGGFYYNWLPCLRRHVISSALSGFEVATSKITKLLKFI
jgi:hypothetical protein